MLGKSFWTVLFECDYPFEWKILIFNQVSLSEKKIVCQDFLVTNVGMHTLRDQKYGLISSSPTSYRLKQYGKASEAEETELSSITLVEV